MRTLSHALEHLATGMGASFSSSSIKLDTILADEKYLIILLSSYCWYKLAFILCHQSKFSIYHSQDKHFSSASSVPAHCSQNSKPLLAVRPVSLSLRDTYVQKDLAVWNTPSAFCMAAAFYPFVFSCFLLPPLSFHCNTSAVPHHGLYLLLSQPGVRRSFHPIFYCLHFY